MATLVSLTQFLPLVMPFAPSVPKPVALNCLRMAAHDFCRETLCWREVVTVTIVNGPVLAAPNLYSALVQIEQAWFGTRRLEPKRFDEIDAIKYDDMTISTTPDYITQIEENMITIYPLVAGAVKISGFFAPFSGPTYSVIATPGTVVQDEENKVPDFVFKNHAEALAHGALGRIKATPGQDYTDFNAAGVHFATFNAAMARVQASNIKGQQRSRVRTKAHWF